MSEEQNATVTQINPAAENDTPPEVAGDIPADPSVLGVVEPQEQSMLLELQRHHQQFVYQIGKPKYGDLCERKR